VVADEGLAVRTSTPAACAGAACSATAARTIWYLKLLHLLAGLLCSA